MSMIAPEERFGRRLAAYEPGQGPRRWVFVPYDQLSARLGPLAAEAPGTLGIVLIEAPHKAGRRPYHKQKLALVLTNLRHFALEQASRGVAVRHVVGERGYAAALAQVVAEVGPVVAMEPAERELRVELGPLVARGALEIIPHKGWMTTADDFHQGAGAAPPWRMDAFYRHVRKRTGILMDRGKPLGGKYSFDADNRRPWPGEPPAPPEPRFVVDAVSAEVAELIEERFGHHPGTLDMERIPATAEHAAAVWQRAKEHCLPHFGPYEDAMSTRSSVLFHTLISPLLNLHRLLPAEVVADAVTSHAPLASIEGFVRQVLGWREFVRHVHRETDGFRRQVGAGSEQPGTGKEVEVAPMPGDGGYARWKGAPWRAARGVALGGARPNHLGAERPLPPAYWGAASGLACLDHVVAGVWEHGYGHHITRLMVLANLATLLDVDPRELTDWFWCAYMDAYDWVVEPNVLGMGTYAAGPLMTTKPYVAGSRYIHSMSDYCAGCGFDPATTCPITPLYWAFLDRHRAELANNPRLRVVMASLGKRSAQARERDAQVFARVSAALARGERLVPGTLPEP